MKNDAMNQIIVEIPAYDFRDSEEFIAYRKECEKAVIAGAHTVGEIRRMQGDRYRAEWVRDALESSPNVEKITSDFFDKYVWKEWRRPAKIRWNDQPLNIR